jgi:spore cortex formation protein SpoVR/YcgB (stage V sporulation)
VSLSTSDIDGLISEHTVRPSFLATSCFQQFGSASGMVSMFIPIQSIHHYVIKGIDDAVSEQLTDSLRTIQSELDSRSMRNTNSETINTIDQFSESEIALAEDIKETIKFHRDVNPFKNVANSNDSADPIASFLSSSTNIVKIGLNCIFAVAKSV